VKDVLVQAVFTQNILEAFSKPEIFLAVLISPHLLI
jgi:hypothetical protein